MSFGRSNSISGTHKIAIRGAVAHNFALINELNKLTKREVLVSAASINTIVFIKNDSYNGIVILAVF